MGQSNPEPLKAPGVLRHEWEVLVSLIIISILYSSLGETLVQLFSLQVPSPETTRIISLAISGLALVTIIISALTGHRRISRIALFIFVGLVSLFLMSGICILVFSLPQLKNSQLGLVLLADAIIVWINNVVLFAVWYWMMDGGGETKRATVSARKKDFLFVQEVITTPGWEGWQPDFTAYLTMSFYNCSTFGPTDTYVLSRRGRLLLILQVLLSGVIVSMFVSRALFLIQ
jgi:hypothetical protein